ncbi:FtsX-like permease family protein [Amycolatopsis sp. PS_44_ISF1]|uniref:ABC transporter permease n=1 Tax=Amycolatopsis sp. PS_44_ISF1 TaxID=2974917 RepID=UPI0028E007D1|nr:FtsX-like permease family protein [Amycolatopsis sp. PS_44_ISF1]MDT8911647.1 ABC transporter permease [Amycolatopsis sp. PS_44_ISF1]
MLRRAFRSILAHRARFLLPTLGVVLGVAFVVGSLLYGDAVRSSVSRAQAHARADVAVEVRPSTIDTPFGDDVVGPLHAIPGVAQIRPTADGYAFLVGKDGQLTGPPERAGGVSYDPARYPLSTGRAPAGPGQVVLDRFTAERTGYRVGDQVPVIVDGKVHQVEVTGLFAAEDARLAGGGTLVAFDLTTARAQFGPAPGSYTAVDLVATPGVSQDELAARVRAALPPPTFDTETGSSLDSVRGDDKLTKILLLFAAVALFVAVFLVSNTFTMLSAARARENALLRAVGASRRYVLRGVLAEAGVLGLIATVLGYLLGIGVAVVLDRGFSVINGPGVPLRVFSGGAVAAALGVGVGVTLVAAYVPARRAAAVPPIAALRSGLPPSAKSLRRRTFVGVAITGLGALTTAAGIRSQDLMYLGAPLLMIGLIVLTPWLALGLTGLLRRPLTRLSGIRGTLAVENTRRNPRRTAATAATLMIGLSVCAAITVMIASVAAKHAKEAETDTKADIQITAIPFADLSSETTAEVAKLPGVQAVSPMIPASIELGQRRFLSATAVDPSSVQGFLPLTVTKGSLDHLAGGIAVSTETARRYDLAVGSEVSGSLQARSSADQPVSLPVVAIYDAPSSSLQSSLIPARLVSAAPQRILVRAAPGQDQVVLRGQIQRTLANPVLTVQTRSEAAAAASDSAAAFLNILYALLSVSVLIGALGVVNTMTMSTLERVREIGLLRAVGLGRKQVGSVLRWESVLTAMLGAGIGLVTGGALGAMGVLSQPGLTLVVPWPRLAVFVLVTLAIGVLASLWPARSAARTPILTAIHADTE